MPLKARPKGSAGIRQAHINQKVFQAKGNVWSEERKVQEGKSDTLEGTNQGRKCATLLGEASRGPITQNLVGLETGYISFIQNIKLLSGPVFIHKMSPWLLGQEWIGNGQGKNQSSFLRDQQRSGSDQDSKFGEQKKWCIYSFNKYLLNVKALSAILQGTVNITCQ